jgi:hypothetical protein
MITRGLNEMLRLNRRARRSARDIMGLAGVGDLVLTCTGDLSRNRRLGLALGRGPRSTRPWATSARWVESIESVNQVMRLARDHELDLPISGAVCSACCRAEITPAEALSALLAALSRSPSIRSRFSPSPWGRGKQPELSARRRSRAGAGSRTPRTAHRIREIEAAALPTASAVHESFPAAARKSRSSPRPAVSAPNTSASPDW